MITDKTSDTKYYGYKDALSIAQKIDSLIGNATITSHNDWYRVSTKYRGHNIQILTPYKGKLRVSYLGNMYDDMYRRTKNPHPNKTLYTFDKLNKARLTSELDRHISEVGLRLSEDIMLFNTFGNKVQNSRLQFEEIAKLTKDDIEVSNSGDWQTFSLKRGSWYRFILLDDLRVNARTYEIRGNYNYTDIITFLKGVKA